MNARHVARGALAAAALVIAAGPVVAYVRPPAVPTDVSSVVVFHYGETFDVAPPSRLDISYEGSGLSFAEALEDCFQSGGEPISAWSPATTDTLVCEGVDY